MPIASSLRTLWFGLAKSLAVVGLLGLMGPIGLLGLLGLAAADASAQQPGKDAASKLDKVAFGTNWVAEAEHGGFYQALADGTYRQYGLDVTIVPGGPQVNNRILLPVGKIDFF